MPPVTTSCPTRFLPPSRRGTIAKRSSCEREEAMPEMTIPPRTPAIGAEISGIDLSQPVDSATREKLSLALAEHLALVFHDQSLPPAQYLGASNIFGPPIRQHYSQHHTPGYPDIGLVWHRNGQQPAERWHTDHTNRERPPAATILYGVEIPSKGGGTSVATMRAAYAACPRRSSAVSRQCAPSTVSIPARTTRSRKIGRSTASRSSIRSCARIRCTARARCSSTSRRRCTSKA